MLSGSRWLKFWVVVNGALVVSLVGSALFGAQGVVRREKLDEDLGEVQQLNDELARQNQALKREIEALKNDDDYVERVIKDELGWVRADELILIFPEKH
ncbi:MAG: septum formation initiator family protein [Myxococcota bacterium]